MLFDYFLALLEKVVVSKGIQADQYA